MLGKYGFIILSKHLLVQARFLNPHYSLGNNILKILLLVLHLQFPALFQQLLLVSVRKLYQLYIDTIPNPRRLSLHRQDFYENSTVEFDELLQKKVLIYILTWLLHNLPLDRRPHKFHQQETVQIQNALPQKYQVIPQ